MAHSEREPSEFFRAREALLREAGRLGPVLDLACGYGRHSLAAARLGLPVLALDRSEEALRSLQQLAPSRVQCVRTDLEAGSDIPVAPESCGAILVFRFLSISPAIYAWSHNLIPLAVTVGVWRASEKRIRTRFRQAGAGSRSVFIGHASGVMPFAFIPADAGCSAVTAVPGPVRRCPH